MKIISFDLDQTLIDDTAVERVWEETIPAAYAHHNNIGVDEAKKIVHAEYDDVYRSHDSQQYKSLHWWINHLGLDHEPRVFYDKITEDITVYDDIAALNDLDEQTALFTNSNRRLMQAKLERLPLSFDTAVSAPTDYEMSKRDEDAWRRYLDDLKVEPGDILHVGDRDLDDVQVPSRLGIKGRLLNRDDEQTGDYTSLHDIKDDIS